MLLFLFPPHFDLRSSHDLQVIIVAVFLSYGESGQDSRCVNGSAADGNHIGLRGRFWGVDDRLAVMSGR